VHRGHSLVADDAVQIKRVSKNVLIGSSPENIRNFIELRGIGILNVTKLFGAGSVKAEEEVTIVVHLENWDLKTQYERMGLEDKCTEILDVKIPILTIPLKSGRNIANIIEIAVKNMRQKKIGYNPAQDLLKSLGMEY
ncbi:MAG: HPr(Ser) kinase/phosphatase, partial [Oscillospiraceae bacterium]